MTVNAEPLVAVLTIGDELLSGEVLDVNTAAVAQALEGIGLVITAQLAVRDVMQDIVRAVRELSASSDILIITGGLGPTNDDITAEAVGSACGQPMVFREQIAERIRSYFHRTGRPIGKGSLRQAYLPERAIEIPAKHGTASGHMLEYNDCLIAVLPGVPSEAAEMMSRSVVPEVARRFKGHAYSMTRRISTFGAGESELYSILSPLIEEGVTTYGFLAGPDGVVIKLGAVAEDRDGASRVLDAEQQRVVALLGELVHSLDDEPMEVVVARLLLSSGRTLAVAESLTGGMLASSIVNVPGASAFFKGGVVAYNEDAKVELLGVSPALLERGQVTEEVAVAMAQGAMMKFSSDFGLGTTGEAGPVPAGSNKPVGTACIAVAWREGHLSLERALPGPRQLIRRLSAISALNILRLHLVDEYDKGISR